VIKRLRSFSKTLAVSLNIGAVILLLLSYLSTHVSPETAPSLAFFGVAYGVFVLLNLFFIIFWLLVKKRLALISVLAILLGFNHLTAYFQVIPDKSMQESKNKMVVLSYNVRLFGWYNWRTNIEDRDRMIRRLELTKADVFCFQEFFHNSRPGTFETKELLKLTLDAPYIYDEYTSHVQKDQHYGIATLSKYPIVNTGRINFDEERSNVCIFTDIVVPGSDTIRVYNAHIASIRFSDNDYRFLDDLKNQEDTLKPDLSKGLSIIDRLKKAYKKRAIQISTVMNHIESSPYPVVFCGDFNDTPVSYAYNLVSRKLEDAFKNGGWGIGNTYLGKFPSFRIDYIFHSDDLISQGYEKLEEETSDHHAIKCEILWGEPE
jgi:endonuclease/exonuclease/phosphatase family metal-dependent hydrolase